MEQGAIARRGDAGFHRVSALGQRFLRHSMLRPSLASGTANSTIRQIAKHLR